MGTELEVVPISAVLATKVGTSSGVTDVVREQI